MTDGVMVGRAACDTGASRPGRVGQHGTCLRHMGAWCSIAVEGLRCKHLRRHEYCDRFTAVALARA
jgi:hypothetical protein